VLFSLVVPVSEILYINVILCNMFYDKINDDDDDDV